MGARSVGGCTAYVACAGLSGSRVPVGLCTICVIEKDEYMPSKTEQNDEHFRAPLIIPSSVTSCCPFLLHLLVCFF